MAAKADPGIQQMYLWQQIFSYIPENLHAHVVF